MTVEIEIAKKEDRKRWNQLISESIYNSIFHIWEWLEIAEKYTKSRLYPIVSYRGEEPIGVFPIFYKKKFGLKMTFSPPPSTAMGFLGPIILNYEKIKEDKRLYYLSEFQKKVDNFIFSDLDSSYALFFLHPILKDCRSFKWTNYRIEPVFHYMLDLTPGPGFLWQQFKKELRENVKKSKKKGVYFEEGEKEDLLLIYESLVERYKEQNKIVQISKNYLLDLYNLFYPKNLRIFVAKKNGEFLTGIIALCFKDTIYFWIGGTKAGLKSLYPNDLLHWEAIKWACEHGYKYYVEFGAGTERLARFKSKFNPNLIVCFSARKYSTFFVRLLESLYGKVRIKL